MVHFFLSSLNCVNLELTDFLSGFEDEDRVGGHERAVLGGLQQRVRLRVVQRPRLRDRRLAVRLLARACENRVRDAFPVW